MSFNGNYSQPPAAGAGGPPVASVQQTLDQMKQMFEQMASTIGQVAANSAQAAVMGQHQQAMPNLIGQALPGQYMQQMVTMAQHNPQLTSMLNQMQHISGASNFSHDMSLPPPVGPPNLHPTNFPPLGMLPPGTAPFVVPPPKMPQTNQLGYPQPGFQQSFNQFNSSQPTGSQPYNRNTQRGQEDRVERDRSGDRRHSDRSRSGRSPQRRSSRSPTRFMGNSRYQDRGRRSPSPARFHRNNSSRSERPFRDSGRDRDRYGQSPSSRNSSDAGKPRGGSRRRSPSPRSFRDERGSSNRGGRYDSQGRSGYFDSQSRNDGRSGAQAQTGDRSMAFSGRPSSGGHRDHQSTSQQGGDRRGNQSASGSPTRRFGGRNERNFPSKRPSFPAFPTGPLPREKPRQYQTPLSPKDASKEDIKKSKNKKGKTKENKNPFRARSVSSESGSSDSSIDFDTLDTQNEDKDDLERLYGAYDERPVSHPHTSLSTKLPDYEESTPAGKYLVKDAESGNMVATKFLTEMQDKFERDVLKRASKAREGRAEYNYPERTARLNCCKKGDCSHDSEDDGTDESDLEEGEIVDSDEENQSEHPKHAPPFTNEIQAKIDHPERVHRAMCYNDKGETNTGPLCKCSRKARRLGVRHGKYAGEKLIESCRPNSSNINRLYHYRISLSSQVNFETKEATTISWDDRDYVFDGFSLFTHQTLEQMTSIRTILYNSYYTIKLVDEISPNMFTVRTLDLVCDYMFYELFELVDISWVQDAFKDGCRQIHIMPRFTRPLPDNGMELLAMPHVLKYLLDNSHPLIESSTLGAVASMDKKVWEEKIVKNYRLTLATIPGMRPSTVRVDNMDRPEQNSKDDVIGYPQILHYVYMSDSLIPSNDKHYQLMVKKRRRLNRYIAKKVTPLTTKDVNDLNNLRHEIKKYMAKRKTADGVTMKRHQLLELNCQGYFATGLRSDVTMWALIIPKVVDHIRFIQSLTFLQADIGYRFKDPSLLQMALSHSSYMSGFCTNQDHIKNTLTNCGFKKLEFGKFSIHKELKVKKRGLKTLLEIMSHKYRQYTGPVYSNERLEFLGDAVLEFITSVHLFYLFPQLEEGGLSTYRTAIVKNQHLTALAKKVGLQHYLLFSHGPDLCFSAQFDHSLANAFEAILGAIFLDGAVNEADKFLAKYLAKSLNFPEFLPVWMDLPLHPLQEKYPDGDRHLIENSPPLQKCVELEKVTGMRFDHICLLARSLTHPSMNYTEFARGSNQTLEYLGDSVLQLIVSDYLYKHYPNHHEGHLTLLRSSLVNNVTLAQIFKDLGIAHYVFRKHQQADIQTKEKADYVEAILGALYVDHGLDMCKGFCKVLFFPRLKETIESQNWNDAKSLLQQCCLELRDPGNSKDPHLPTYKVVGKSGPSHNMIFKVAVYYKGERIGVGEASSIKSGQFEAAQNALDANHAMFPMLMPGTNKLHTLGKQSLVQYIRHKRQKIKLRRSNMSYTSF